MADKRARDQLARAAARFRAGLPALVLMTDDERLPDPLAAARALPRGSMVILRARDTARRTQLAAALRSIAKAGGLKLLIASDAALAARTGAHGIHLPHARVKEAAHWRARYPHWIITVAAHLPGAAVFVRQADAILLAPVFPTQSHPGEKTLGPIALRTIVRHAQTPIYALGGVDRQTVRQLVGARLAGIAAIGALSPGSCGP